MSSSQGSNQDHPKFRIRLQGLHDQDLYHKDLQWSHRLYNIGKLSSQLRWLLRSVLERLIASFKWYLEELKQNHVLIPLLCFNQICNFHLILYMDNQILAQVDFSQYIGKKYPLFHRCIHVNLLHNLLVIVLRMNIVFQYWGTLRLQQLLWLKKPSMIHMHLNLLLEWLRLSLSNPKSQQDLFRLDWNQKFSHC